MLCSAGCLPRDCSTHSRREAPNSCVVREEGSGCPRRSSQRGEGRRTLRHKLVRKGRAATEVPVSSSAVRITDSPGWGMTRKKVLVSAVSALSLTGRLFSFHFFSFSPLFLSAPPSCSPSRLLLLFHLPPPPPPLLKPSEIPNFTPKWRPGACWSTSRDRPLFRASSVSANQE